VFKYVQSTDADASDMFNFTVPYSTGIPSPDGTQFAVLAEQYVITAGNITRAVQISEDQVMNGETIYVDLRQSI
jgi:dolichyl-diphosphooligosaccharide--protein glycosyltransferase